MDKSKQAFPVPYEVQQGGMTLREYAAVAAMQGLIPTYKGNASFDDAGAEHLANQCVYLADALLARLEEKQ